MNHIELHLHIKKDAFEQSMDCLISKAGKIGFIIHPEMIEGSCLTPEEIEAGINPEVLPDFSIEHKYLSERNLINLLPDSQYLEISVAYQLSHEGPRNEFEQFAAFLYRHLFRTFVDEMNPYNAKLFLYTERNKYSLWLLGSGNGLIEFYKLGPKPDDEPYLFTAWLSDPDAVQLSRDDVFTPRPTSVCSGDYHNKNINFSLPIAFDESLQSLILSYYGGRALIGNNLINGKLIPVPPEARDRFFGVNEIERHEANMTAATLHSIEDITARFGSPDYELPGTKWKPAEEWGENIIRQPVYIRLSEKHVYLFRCWQSGLITLMLLGKERQGHGAIGQWRDHNSI